MLLTVIAQMKFLPLGMHVCLNAHHCSRPLLETRLTWLSSYLESIPTNDNLNTCTRFSQSQNSIVKSFPRSTFFHYPYLSIHSIDTSFSIGRWLLHLFALGVVTESARLTSNDRPQNRYLYPWQLPQRSRSLSVTRPSNRMTDWFTTCPTERLSSLTIRHKLSQVHKFRMQVPWCIELYFIAWRNNMSSRSHWIIQRFVGMMHWQR